MITPLLAQEHSVKGGHGQAERTPWQTPLHTVQQGGGLPRDTVQSRFLGKLAWDEYRLMCPGLIHSSLVCTIS